MSYNFNDQLSRMKALMTYGSVNEDAKPISTYSIEYSAKAADGKFYGIIRENSKYYVKVATPGKETIAESYQYIGGINNKPNYEYNSYANALKQFELKLGSINEAYDENRRVVVEALDPFKKEDLVIEGTENMKNELARQRQIMRNASVIMNEATEIGSTPFKSQPESEHDNSGDKDYPFVKKDGKAQPEGDIKFDNGKPEKQGSPFAKNADVEDYDLDKGKEPKVAGSVASESPKGGKVTRVNESFDECGGPLYTEEDEELLGDEEEPVDTDELIPLDGEDEEPEDDELEGKDDEEEPVEDDEFEDEEDVEFADEEGDEFEDDDDEFDDEEEEFDDEEEFGEDDEFEDEEEPMDDEEDPEIELDENVVRKFRKLIRESIEEIMDEWDADDDLRAKEKGYNGIEDEIDRMDVPSEFDRFGDDADEEDDEREIAGLDDDGEFEEDDEDFEDTEKYGDEVFGEDEPLNEAKTRKMNRIVESVVRDIMNEDELHVFGDHPGYRKKPMTLPQTGSDEFQGNRDWNDDSVHSEEPFGKGKGDSTPFDELVSQITDSVMKQINENKKKVK